MEQNSSKTKQATDLLSLDDLNVSGVDIFSLSQEETMGVPELGASYGVYGSSTNSSVTAL